MLSRFPLHKALRQVLLASVVAASVPILSAQEAVTQTDTATINSVIVTGAELPSAYGAPPAFSRTRFAPTTTAYVLPPGAFLAATIYQGNAFPHGRPQHFFTQEVEVGLPHRFGLAAEVAAELYHGESQIRSVSLEARYAFADWNKIPLNPTVFVEYKFGTGRVLKDEAIAMHDGGEMPAPEALRKLTSKIARAEEDEEDAPPKIPDAFEARLLLAQDFGERLEWALNGFVEVEIGGDRGREWGFAQSIVTPLTRNEYLKAGVEMLYTNFSDKGIRDDAENRFVIGPTVAWKPSRWSRIDVSPLFGVNNSSPRAQVFVVFSMLFGGSSSGEAETPASMRNR